jgi:hypothetical protein
VKAICVGPGNWRGGGTSIYEHPISPLDVLPFDLEGLQGKPVLIVNVASKASRVSNGVGSAAEFAYQVTMPNGTRRRTPSNLRNAAFDSHDAHRSLGDPPHRST